MSPREFGPSQPDAVDDHALAIMKALVSLGEAEPNEYQRGLLEEEADNLTVEETVALVKGEVGTYPAYFYINPQTGTKTKVKPDLARRLLAYKRSPETPETPEETYEITLPRELVDRGKALVDEIAKTWTHVTDYRLQHSLGISEREAAALLEQLQISGHVSYRHKEGLGYVIGKFDTREAPTSPKDRSRGRKIIELATTERTRQTSKEILRTKQAQIRNLGRKANRFASFVSGESHRAKKQRIQDEIDAYKEQKRQEEAKRDNPRWHTTVE